MTETKFHTHTKQQAKVNFLLRLLQSDCRSVATEGSKVSITCQ